MLGDLFITKPHFFAYFDEFWKSLVFSIFAHMIIAPSPLCDLGIKFDYICTQWSKAISKC